MTTETYNALIEHLWEITNTDKLLFCKTDIKIHTTKSFFNDYKTIKYSVVKNNSFVKHTYIISIDNIKRIEIKYKRNNKLDEILNNYNIQKPTLDPFL